MPAAGWMRSMRGMPLVSKFILNKTFSSKAEIHPGAQPPLKADRARDPQSQCCVNSGDPVIRHDSQAAGERFGLPRGERLPNIEGPKKYKAQQQTFPVEQREWREVRDHLARNFIDHNE